MISDLFYELAYLNPHEDFFRLNSSVNENSNKQDEFLKTILTEFESIEKVVYRINSEREVAGYYPWVISKNIAFMVEGRMLDQSWYDHFTHTITNGFGMFTNYYKFLCESDHDLNLLRKQDGSLQGRQYFSSCNSKLALQAFLKSAIKYNDTEGFDLLVSTPYFKRFLQRGKINSLFDRVKIPVDSPLGKHVFGETKASNDPDIVNLLSITDNKTDLDVIRTHYTSELGMKHGYIIFSNLLNIAYKAKGPAVDLLLESLVTDGADLYLGFKMFQIGNTVKPDIQLREKNPSSELKEMLSLDSSDKLKKLKPIMLNMLTSMDANLVQSLIDDPVVGKMVARSFKIKKDKDLSPRM